MNKIELIEKILKIKEGHYRNKANKISLLIDDYSLQSNTEQARDDEIEDLVSIFWGDNYNKDDFEAIKESVLNWILSHPPKSEVVSDTTHPLVKEKEDKKQDDLSFIKCLYCKKFVDDCTC